MMPPPPPLLLPSLQAGTPAPCIYQEEELIYWLDFPSPALICTIIAQELLIKSTVSHWLQLESQPTQPGMVASPVCDLSAVVIVLRCYKDLTLSVITRDGNLGDKKVILRSF